MSMARLVGSLAHPDHHLDAWAAVCAGMQMYPAGVDIPPLRRPRKREPAAKLTTARLSRYGKHARATTHGYVLELFDERQHLVIDLPDGPDQAEQLRAALFTSANRGRMIIFANEDGAELDGIWRDFALGWAEAGYVLEPIGPLHQLAAIRVKRQKQLWRLCSATHVTGVPLSALRRQNRRLGPRKNMPATAARRLWLTLEWLQQQLLDHFGVGFKVTIGAAALKAAAFHMPEASWLWRPNPLLVAMCRAGGGYRGGHQRSDTYSGPAWSIDVRRMYTGLLAKELPLRVSFGPWQGPEDAEGGIFMCTVRGRGKRPVYLSRYNSETQTFDHGLWNGEECTCILTSDEMKALGRIGFLCLGGYGFHFWRTFNLKSYVGQLQRLTRKHGAKSAIGLLCKKLGNTVYGKWGQSPHRWDLAFSIDAPSDDWQPYTDDRGDELPYLWTHAVTRWRYTQHVELATVITALGRCQLYTKLAELLEAGYEPAKENTDCIWIRGPAPPDAPPADGPIGSWRFMGYEARTTMQRTGAYLFGRKVARPGSSNPDPAKILSLYRKEAAGVAGGLQPGEAVELAG